MNHRGPAPTTERSFEASGPRARLVWGGAAASAFCLSALAARGIWVGRPALLFLVWNLFLAWTPLSCNALVAMIRRRGLRWLERPGVVLDFAWLMFLPNAPYLVTDLIHLTGRTLAGRSVVPLWFDVLLFSSFAATGCWLGLVSLDSVIARVARRFGQALSAISAGLVCLLCGYGVYLGRFLRFNSWDVVQRPTELSQLALAPLLEPVDHPRAIAFTLGFGAFFGLQWLLLTLASPPRPPARPAIDGGT